jgi:hypothetical protein
MLQDPNIERYVSERLELIQEQIKELQAEMFRQMQVKKCPTKESVVVKKLYSVDDIYKIIKYMNENYSKIEDELIRLYEDKGEDLLDDFFESTYDFCLKQAIDSIK